MLRIRNFSKSYNDRLILKIDELEFKKGAYWIKGENGSGKTTLFESLAGILPCEGEIAFSDGINIRQAPVAYRQRVNYGEAEPLYPGFLTAKDLVRFVGKTRGASREQQGHYVRWFGVDAFFESPCETFSSGMMKKLSLTLAFLGSPQVIILDEPLITLDQQARETLFDLIRKKLDEGVIFLISSHHTIADHDITVAQTFQVENKTLTPQ
jgi:ABC-2 type transport system ATP-binding protein